MLSNLSEGRPSRPLDLGKKSELRGDIRSESDSEALCFERLPMRPQRVILSPTLHSGLGTGIIAGSGTLCGGLSARAELAAPDSELLLGGNSTLIQHAKDITRMNAGRMRQKSVKLASADAEL